MLLTSSPPPLAPPSSLPPLLPPPPPSSSQSSFRRRGNCTMAMLLGDDSLDTRCRYPSKLCRNTRVRKASGALHRYCAYHRSKANNNQKRWVDRQRDTTLSPSSSSASSEPSSPSVPQPTYNWIVATTSRTDTSHATSPDKRDLPRKALRVADEPPRATHGKARATDGASVTTLSEDDWDSLLSILEPTKPRDASHSRPHRDGQFPYRASR